MKPGISVMPRASICLAPAAPAVPAPIDAMRPLRTTMAPDSMTEPLPTMMRALEMTRSWAARFAGIAKLPRHARQARAESVFMARGYARGAAPGRLVLLADGERPDLREVDLLDRHGLHVGLGEEAWQIEIRFEADVHGERRDRALHARENRVRAAEVIQDDDLAARFADTPHLFDDLDRIGHDADQVWRIYDVEGIVGEDEMRGIHLLQADMPKSLAPDPLARFLQHGRREIDAGDGAAVGIERGVGAAAD